MTSMTSMRPPRETDVRIAINAPLDVADLAETWLNEHAEAAGYPFDVEGVSLVATDARGNPIGALSGHTLYGRLHIGRLATHPDHRGRGVGRRLMEEAAAWARGRQLHSLTLSTWEHQAEDFYVKLGFVVVGRLAPCPGSPAKVFLELQL